MKEMVLAEYEWLDEFVKSIEEATRKLEESTRSEPAHPSKSKKHAPMPPILTDKKYIEILANVSRHGIEHGYCPAPWSEI